MLVLWAQMSYGGIERNIVCVITPLRVLGETYSKGMQSLHQVTPPMLRLLLSKDAKIRLKPCKPCLVGIH